MRARRQRPRRMGYAAPKFHLVQELNVAYLANSVAVRSCFIRPRDIGVLTYDRHCIAYDDYHYFVCSQPRNILGQNGKNIGGLFLERLSTEERPLQEGIIQEVLDTMEAALKRTEISPQSVDLTAESSVPRRIIHQIADLALRYFGAQFFLVQKILPVPDN
jgi:hypothetical protein